jgi:hypothetical protein
MNATANRLPKPPVSSPEQIMTQRIPWQLLIVIALAVSVVALRYRSPSPDIDPIPTPSAIADTAEAMQLVESRLRSELYTRSCAQNVDSGKLTNGGGIQEALRNGNLDIARQGLVTAR